MIFVALFFFLSPRRRSGERTEERGGPSSPQPSPPSDGGEGVFGCSSAALYQYLWKLFHFAKIFSCGESQSKFLCVRFLSGHQGCEDSSADLGD